MRLIQSPYAKPSLIPLISPHEKKKLLNAVLLSVSCVQVGGCTPAFETKWTWNIFLLAADRCSHHAIHSGKGLLCILVHLLTLQTQPVALIHQMISSCFGLCSFHLRLLGPTLFLKCFWNAGFAPFPKSAMREQKRKRHSLFLQRMVQGGAMLAFCVFSMPSARGRAQDCSLETHEKQKHPINGSKNSAEHPHSRTKVKGFWRCFLHLFASFPASSIFYSFPSLPLFHLLTVSLLVFPVMLPSLLLKR